MIESIHPKNLMLLLNHYLFYKLSYSDGLYGGLHAVRIFIISDNSGYFIITKNAQDTNIPGIWKYLYSSPTTNSCIHFPSWTAYPQTMLMISDSQFALTAKDSSINYYFYKVTFGSSTADWSNQILWSSSPSWVTGIADMALSSDSTNLYTFFPYGTAAYLHFITFNLSTGNVVGTSYVSNSIITNVYGITVSGNYIVAVVNDSTYGYIVIFNISTSAFTIKTFSGNLNGCVVDSTSGR